MRLGGVSISGGEAHRLAITAHLRHWASSEAQARGHEVHPVETRRWEIPFPLLRNTTATLFAASQ